MHIWFFLNYIYIVLPFTLNNVDKLTLLNVKGVTNISLYVVIIIIINHLFRATPLAYGSFQARGLIGAVAAGLHHSHRNSGSESHLRPTLQLTATPGPLPTDLGQGLNLHPCAY